VLQKWKGGSGRCWGIKVKMRKTLIILLISFAFSQAYSRSKADTIDNYWVLYNDSVLGKYGIYGDHIITVKKSEIKTTDSIRINYFSDTPYPGKYDAYTLNVYADASDKAIIKSKKGHFSFSLHELLNSTEPQFLIYFGAEGRQRILFKLRLE
jgi:hypothetical protein